MSTQKICESKDNNMYIITSVFSGYKENVHSTSVKNVFRRSFDNAQELMTTVALQYIEHIENSDKQYVDIRKDIVCFGKDSDEGRGCGQVWGLVKLEKADMQSLRIINEETEK